MPMPARNVPPPQTHDANAAPRPRLDAAALHEPTLTAADYTLLASLPEQRAGDRVRSDMGLLLADEDTNQSLVRYGDFFAFGGIDVKPAVETLPKLIALQRLLKHLELSTELVRRHINAVGEPAAEVCSDVRRLVMATPEGSAMRAAFATFDARWRETFRGGRSPAADDNAADTSKPAQPK